MRWRTNNAAALKRITESATCTTTSPWPKRLHPRVSAAAPPISRSDDDGAETKACQAGTSPNSKPVITAAPAAKSSTCTSRWTGICSGCGMWIGDRPDAMIFTNACAPKYANDTPHTPPAVERSSDSVSTCRAIRNRPAPNATRTAISRRRAAPRASNMLATLMHASSSSTTTAAIISNSELAKRSRRIESPAPAGSTSIATWRHCTS